MKILKTAIIAAMLAAGSVYADGLGLNVGPFNLQFGGYGGDYVPTNRNALDQPICYAISHQNRLDIAIESVEIVNSKEKKIVSKRLILEPYAFGVTRDGKPVLRGNIIEEKLIKEVTVKYGDAMFDETAAAPDEKDKGYFSGKLSNDKNQNIDIRKVVEIKVLKDWHFDAPKDYKGLNDKDIQVICQLPVAEKK